MAYELTTAATSTGNPYVIVGAAIIDTIRANAKQTATTKGQGLQQNQLSADSFGSYITNALGQSGMQNRGGPAESVFQEALTRRSSGTFAQITAPTTTKINDSQTTKKSIICTTLVELGELHPLVYAAGIPHWHSRPEKMISGYHKWGYSVAALCRKSLLVRKICGYWARSRYLYIVFEQRNFAGWLTVAIGERLCYMIGDRNAFN